MPSPSSKQRAERLSAYVDELLDRNDRAAAIVGAAGVDELLRKLLAKVLAPPSGATDDLLGRTLQSMDAKATLVHRLGLIDDPTREMIRLIGGIRNKMAHRFREGSLVDGEVKGQVRDLVGLMKARSAPGAAKLDEVALLKHPGFSGMKEQALRFRVALAIVMVALDEATLRATRIALRRPLVPLPTT